ncbi:hypothetical protein GCM10022221_68480 [Actinocorallia aurea]
MLAKMSEQNAERLTAAMQRVKSSSEEESARAIARDNAEALAETLRQRAVYRLARYTAQRPAGLDNTRLDALHPQQDPDGRATGWLDSSHKTLLLMGPSGHGKTWAAYAIANAAAERGEWVEAWSATTLQRELGPLPVHAARDTVRAHARERLTERLADVPLLLLDDLGAEDLTGWGGSTGEQWRAALLDILTARDAAPGLRLIVTLNGADTLHLPPADRPAARARATGVLSDRYGARIVTRLQRDCIGAWIEGDCYRQAATWNPF